VVAALLLVIPVVDCPPADLGTAILVMAAGLSVIYFAFELEKLIRPVYWGWWLYLVIFFEPRLCATGCAGRCCMTTSSSAFAPCSILARPAGQGFHIIQA